jgi:hypothetical protein
MAAVTLRVNPGGEGCWGMLLLALLAMPVVFGVTVFFLGKRRITPGELATQLGVVGALVVGGYYLTRWGGIQDYELWNGRIASAPSGSTGCCHSYACNCRQECSTDSEGTTTCSEVCDTCYEHASDSYYAAYTTNDERVYYSSCWAPGEGPPSAWSQIRIGEPTVVEHRYTNYVLADPSEFVTDAGVEFDAAIPPYPPVVGWRARRFLVVDAPIDPVELLRLDGVLDELNADLGARKQVNVIVVVAGHADPAFFDALVRAWLGGKKNDVIVVIGAPAFPEIAWVRAHAWNKASGGEDELIGGLTGRIQALRTFDGDAILAAARDEVERNYVRRSFSELEYLMARARPPGWAVTLLFGIGLGLSALLHWRFWGNRRRMQGRAPHERVRALLARWRRPRGDAAEPASAPEHAAPEAGLPRVSVQVVETVHPIRGADRIERIRVAGRTVVVGKGLLRRGDRCVYFAPGCVLPADAPWARWLREHDFRVVTRSFCGVRSEGLVLPLSELATEPIRMFAELSDELGVTWQSVE